MSRTLARRSIDWCAIFSLAEPSWCRAAGATRPTSSPIMARTTRSSSRVKPRCPSSLSAAPAAAPERPVDTNPPDREAPAEPAKNCNTNPKVSPLPVKPRRVRAARDSNREHKAWFESIIRGRVLEDNVQSVVSWLDWSLPCVGAPRHETIRWMSNHEHRLEDQQSWTGRLGPLDRGACHRQFHRGANSALAGRAADRPVAFPVREVRRGTYRARPRPADNLGADARTLSSLRVPARMVLPGGGNRRPDRAADRARGR